MYNSNHRIGSSIAVLVFNLFSNPGRMYTTFNLSFFIFDKILSYPKMSIEMRLLLVNPYFSKLQIPNQYSVHIAIFLFSP